jgi:hypothetical protein
MYWIAVTDEAVTGIAVYGPGGGEVQNLFSLQWTDTIPELEGWYWMLPREESKYMSASDDKQIPIIVYYWENGDIYAAGYDDCDNVANFSHRLGPLPIPKMP